MVDLGERVAPVDGPHRRGSGRARRRLALVVCGLVLLLVGATATSIRVVSRYADATPLQCTCGLGWTPPDNVRETQSTAGLHDAMNVPADPTRRQGFFVDIINRSPVTQTVLGSATARSDAETVYRGRLTISADDVWLNRDKPIRFTSGPVTIKPGGQYTLHYSVYGRCIQKDGSLIFDSLPLRVRVGWFTRTETVTFGNTSFVLKGTDASSPCPGR
jgi:hypothetical protein